MYDETQLNKSESHYGGKDKREVAIQKILKISLENIVAKLNK